MRRASLILFLAASAPNFAEAAALPFEIQSVKLDNGLQLVMVPFSSPGLIAYYSMVRVGSRDEVEKGVTGFAHFFEHMMFRGTDKFPPEAVDRFLKKTGADQNGFTTDDFTCYTFFGSNAHLEELVTIEADRFQNLKYTEDVFKTESKAVLGEYNKSASMPELKLEERLRELTFKAHPYGHTTLGYLKDIEDMPNQYAYSLKFFQRFYTPDNTTLIVVGDFDPKNLEALVRQHYGPWKTKRAVTEIKSEPPQKSEIRDQISWPTPTIPMLSLSWRTPAADLTKIDTAVYFIVYDLLFAPVTPLYTELVLEKQLVQGIEDWSRLLRDPGLFHTVLRVKDAKNIAVVEQRVDGSVADLAAGKIDAQLLADVKSRMRYQTILGLDTPSKVANLLAWITAPTGEPESLEKILAAVETVTPADVQKFAQAYFTKTNRQVMTVTTKELVK